MAIAYRENLSHRVRHMRIRDRWVRELCQTDLRRIYYCATTENPSDSFTKKFITGRTLSLPFPSSLAATMCATSRLSYRLRTLPKKLSELTSPMTRHRMIITGNIL